MLKFTAIFLSACLLFSTQVSAVTAASAAKDQATQLQQKRFSDLTLASFDSLNGGNENPVVNKFNDVVNRINYLITVDGVNFSSTGSDKTPTIKVQGEEVSLDTLYSDLKSMHYDIIKKIGATSIQSQNNSFYTGFSKLIDSIRSLFSGKSSSVDATDSDLTNLSTSLIAETNPRFMKDNMNNLNTSIDTDEQSLSELRQKVIDATKALQDAKNQKPTEAEEAAINTAEKNLTEAKAKYDEINKPYTENYTKGLAKITGTAKLSESEKEKFSTIYEAYAKTADKYTEPAVVAQELKKYQDGLKALESQPGEKNKYLEYQKARNKLASNLGSEERNVARQDVSNAESAVKSKTSDSQESSKKRAIEAALELKSLETKVGTTENTIKSKSDTLAALKSFESNPGVATQFSALLVEKAKVQPLIDLSQKRSLTSGEIEEAFNKMYGKGSWPQDALNEYSSFNERDYATTDEGRSDAINRKNKGVKKFISQKLKPYEELQQSWDGKVNDAIAALPKSASTTNAISGPDLNAVENTSVGEVLGSNASGGNTITDGDNAPPVKVEHGNSGEHEHNREHEIQPAIDEPHDD